MTLRITATVLWFAAGWSAVGMLAGIMGMPSSLAMVGGIATAMIVWLDPGGRLLGRAKATRRVRPINEVAAELDQQAGRGSVEVRERA
jgi:hypothetical protein